MESLRIQPRPPYSLERTIGAFARFPEELVDRVEAGTYRRLIVLQGQPVLVQVDELDPSASNPFLRLARLSGHLPLDEAAARVTRMLAVHEPLDELYETLANHPTLSVLSVHLAGLRRTVDPDPVEGLVSSVLAQLISIRGAAVIRARVVRRFGTSVTLDDQEYWSFPQADALAGSSVDELCSIGMTRAKANAILAIAAAALTGELDLEQLERESDETIRTHLISLPGIGPWTADWFLVNVMGRMRVVPSGDLGIRRSTGNWLLGGRMPSPDEVRDLYDPFGEHRAYVAYYVLSAERLGIQPPSNP